MNTNQNSAVRAKANAQVSIHYAADFDLQTYEAFELGEQIKQAQTASDENAAIATLEKHLDALKEKLSTRKAELHKSVKVEHLKSLVQHAQSLGYDSAQEMFEALNFNATNKIASIDNATKKSSRRTSKAPKILRHLLREDATDVTDDDAKGYERLPKKQQATGKYRPATPTEIAQMQAALTEWEVQYGQQKKH